MLPIVIALFAPIVAQGSADVSRTVDRLTECRAIAADGDRLACFDRLAARIAAARTSGDLLVLDRRQVVERKRQRFGLANPPSDVFGGGEADRATEVSRLDTTIRMAKPAGPYGRWNLELANGSVWQSVDTLPFPPKASAPIALRTATLGGFRASIAGGRTFLVKRLR
ncbi:hypothetical protein [uncultured Sphingomonas sp.]|uniref:hypothetical protein n=1 Tax=uncultured Sphingomonas sp. TaxID=158754 RepID=UPI0035CA2D6D